MSGVNKVMLIGHIGQDIEVKTTESGIKVARFSVATSERWIDKNTGEKKEETEWSRVVVWRKSAEFAEKYLKKGSKVYVEGKLKTDKYTDKDNIERYTTNIIASQIQGLDKAPSSRQSEPPLPTEEQAPSTNDGSDELPPW